MSQIRYICISRTNECGVALVTVLLITALLLTATIAMLTALGAGARETSDVLNETKAYYAAESGIQATINILRNDSAPTPYPMYQYVIEHPEFLGARLPYNWPTGTPARAVVGQSAATYDPNSGTAYTVEVSDPDNSLTSATFNITARFNTTYINGNSVAAITGTCLDTGGNPISPTPTKCSTIQYGTTPNRTTIYADSIPSYTADFTTNPPVAGFHVVNESGGAGTRISDPLSFEVSYNLTAPQIATALLRGTVTQAAVGSQITATFLTQNYTILSSNIHLTTPSIPIPVNGSSQITATLHPIQPHRLKVVSTGYGPNGAQKQLEAIVRRNLFDGLGSSGTTTMVGTSNPPAGSLPFLYSPGSSNGITYSGGDCSSSTGCVPAFVLTDPANYSYVVSNPPQNGTVSPPPTMTDTSSLPSWQQTPADLDSLIVDPARLAAQHDGTYYVNPGGNIQNPGDYASGTGVTFCEGSCKVSGDGGGLLVVTGKLTNVGGFNFKGIIIVTGEEGWDRSGGGSGSVLGNVVIAPYNKRSYVPENLSATFLAPRYQISGGGASDVIYGDINASFDNTSGISDLVAGVAEK